MPAERRAQFRGLNVPRSRISKHAPFRIYEHTQCQVFERISLQRACVIPCQQQMGSSAVLRACRSTLVLAAWTGVLRPYLHYGYRGRLQNDDGPEFSNSNSVIFENFLKFSKRRRTVPLRPIWTIMVTAKLDHSRVLVTKFHQNRSTLKGRSAGQRHIHRETNSAENNGPSGLQSGQNTQYSKNNHMQNLYCVTASIARMLM